MKVKIKNIKAWAVIESLTQEGAINDAVLFDNTDPESCFCREPGYDCPAIFKKRSDAQDFHRNWREKIVPVIITYQVPTIKIKKEI